MLTRAKKTGSYVGRVAVRALENFDFQMSKKIVLGSVIGIAPWYDVLMVPVIRSVWIALF